MPDITTILLEVDQLKEQLIIAEHRNQAFAEEIRRQQERLDQMDHDLAELSALVKIRTRPTKVSAMNICALDETQDSGTCPDSTVYRYQQGCRGVACVRKYKDYYTDYQKRKPVADTELDTVE